MKIKNQLDRLAYYIMTEVEGEPAQDEGAGDCAIRIIKSLAKKNDELALKLLDPDKLNQIALMEADLHRAVLLLREYSKRELGNWIEVDLFIGYLEDKGAF